jgi:hypothetical protein
MEVRIVYLIRDDMTGGHILTHDPSSKEYEGFVAEIGHLELPAGVGSLIDLYRWRDGSPHPTPILGLDRRNENCYKVFQCERDCRSNGYEILGSNFHYVDTLSDYEKDTGRTLKRKSL